MRRPLGGPEEPEDGAEGGHPGGGIGGIALAVPLSLLVLALALVVAHLSIEALVKAWAAVLLLVGSVLIGGAFYELERQTPRRRERERREARR